MQTAALSGSCAVDISTASDTVSDAALCGLWFLGQKHFPTNTDNWIEKTNLPVFHELRTWLDLYFFKNQLISKERQISILTKKLASLPLAPQGTVFQKSVWKLHL